MRASNRDRIRTLLKGIETGDPQAVLVVNEDKYIQHNPTTAEGSPGLAQLFAELSKTDPHVELHRMFEDGDFVFGHVEYDFAETAVGFEVFRFEEGYAVEHWDNLQRIAHVANQSGHSMVDGPREATDIGNTESNRAVVESYVHDVLLGNDLEALSTYVGHLYAEHNPDRSDGLDVLQSFLRDGTLRYGTRHRVLAEGDFVLAACEGERGGLPVAIYDLFRLVDGKLVEHWDSIEPIAPREHWQNDNGKF